MQDAGPLKQPGCSQQPGCWQTRDFITHKSEFEHELISIDIHLLAVRQLDADRAFGRRPRNDACPTSTAASSPTNQANLWEDPGTASLMLTARFVMIRRPFPMGVP